MLTLAVAGTVHGVVLVAQSLTLGSPPGAVDGGMAAVVALFEIARSALLGMLAGLAAMGLQLAGGGRR
ncbi:hypothetical protein FHU38_003276 [Saccharomonospora amisosensis]|uniref:Uncharacterized protein n=1 Tax=Saccharomonospora amisosensis TaxID=1128677 RepID=A0A7X5URM2_9PSEU|nr:hypothetical protein [Saccharomonospora amisosensis]NIJ12932.1 hypothetical protein [Saccharomonospora amisosensis]